jgi:hypothetical protein
VAQSGFQLFPGLNDYLSGHKLASDDDVRAAVMRLLKSRGTEFYEVGINKLVPRVDKCLIVGRTMLNNKVVSIDNACYLFCSKWQYVHLEYMRCELIFGLPALGRLG